MSPGVPPNGSDCHPSADTVMVMGAAGAAIGAGLGVARTTGLGFGASTGFGASAGLGASSGFDSFGGSSFVMCGALPVCAPTLLLSRLLSRAVSYTHLTLPTSDLV